MADLSKITQQFHVRGGNEIPGSSVLPHGFKYMSIFSSYQHHSYIFNTFLVDSDVGLAFTSKKKKNNKHFMYGFDMTFAQNMKSFAHFRETA